MKTNIKNLFPCRAVAWRRRVLPALIAVLNLLPAVRLTAQTFTTLHSFTAPNYDPSSGNFTNTDGAVPYARLIANSSGNTLYGTTYGGGSLSFGTVFAVNTDGTGFTILHPFTNGNDGGDPQAGLIRSGNTLYGTTYGGGSFGWGTVFAGNTDGTGFTNLHSFNPYSGEAKPHAGLILSGNTLYGTALHGGSSGNGTVFALSTDGTGLTTLHSFTATHTNSFGVHTNSDGSDPYAGLVLSGNTLYGTTRDGGSSGRGTVFALNTNGTGFTNLHTFTTNSDGSGPVAGLLLSGNILYGAASYGGSSGYGTVFAVNTNGTGFTNLHGFTGSDGAYPSAELILSGNTLYGTAQSGGSSGYGTVFAVHTDGTGFTKLHSFAGGGYNPSGFYTNSDGAYPQAGLILSGNTLYGTAYYGGSSGNGTVFSLSFRPQLTIVRSGTNVILTWPTNVAGFDYTGYTLQSTTNPVSPVVWSTNLPAPVVIAGQNTVTNPITGAQQFYRLVH